MEKNPKYQWLEGKCLEYKKKYSNKKARVKELEKLLSENNADIQLYNQQVEHDTKLIKNSLGSAFTSFNQLMLIPNPISYENFYHEIMHKLCTHFADFVRAVKKHLEFISSTDRSPIFANVNKGFCEEISKNIDTIQRRFYRLTELMNSSGWALGLSLSEETIRAQLINWINSAKDIIEKLHNTLKKSCDQA